MGIKHLRIRFGACTLVGAVCVFGVPPLSGNEMFADTPPVTTLPGGPVTPGILRWQREADEAFERGDFERAHWIFLKKLAGKGDKHAHYMVGYLNEHGLGVTQDLSRALAWYALAAERGSSGAKSVGLQLLEKLSASEEQRADTILSELMKRYGDRALLVKAVVRDRREVLKRTGTHVGSNANYLLIKDLTNDGLLTNGDRYYGALEDRIEYRTQLLGGTATLGELELIDPPEEDPPESEEP